MKKPLSLMLALSLGITVFSGNLLASEEGHYKITITNLTRGSLLTPALAVSHERGIKIFMEGAPASDALAQLAEGGNTQPVQDMLFASGKAHAAAHSGPILPGHSVSMMVATNDEAKRISLVSMLLPTNDGFIALNAVKGPQKGKTKTYYVPAYDAGSELNDEHCVNIPGPHCGGEGYNAAGGEGFVHIHAGIHGGGDLVAADYDWRNPVARIMIERVK